MSKHRFKSLNLCLPEHFYAALGPKKNQIIRPPRGNKNINKVQRILEPVPAELLNTCKTAQIAMTK